MAVNIKDLLTILNTTNTQKNDQRLYDFLRRLLDGVQQINTQVGALVSSSSSGGGGSTTNITNVQQFIDVFGSDDSGGGDSTPIPGQQGATGVAGPQGPSGVTTNIVFSEDSISESDSLIPGPIGSIGPSGITTVVTTNIVFSEDGVSESDSLIPGPRGIDGTIGINGAQGIQGVPLIDVHEPEDPLLIPGPKGNDGAIGAVGSQGPIGVPLIDTEFPDDPLIIPGPKGDIGPSASSISPGFAVNKGGTNQTITSATYTKVTFSTEEFDYGNYFASDKYLPLVAGRYVFTGLVTYNTGNTGDAYEIVLYKNGILKREPFLRFPSTNGNSIVGAWIEDMNGTTDFVELYTWQGSLSSKDISGVSSQTYFQGSLLSGGAQGIQGIPGITLFDEHYPEDPPIIPGPSSVGLFTDFTKDLGSGYKSGTFDITGLLGINPDKDVLIIQTAQPIASKGNARDEFEMDNIELTGYVLNNTTIRAYWNAPSIVVGTYAFSFSIGG